MLISLYDLTVERYLKPKLKSTQRQSAITSVFLSLLFYSIYFKRIRLADQQARSSRFFSMFIFNFFVVDIFCDMQYKIHMRGKNYFLHPVHDWQRRYEALRASFVDRLPARIIAERFGYSVAYVHLLRHQFTHGKIDFSEPVPEGKAGRKLIDAAVRAKIRAWREHRLSAGEIAQLLSEEGVEVSVRTVERVLSEEGFEKLPRRTRLKIGLTVKGSQVPQKSSPACIKEMHGQRFDSDGAGIFLFAPLIQQLDLPSVVKDAGLPGTSAIPALNYLLSFLAVKLIGTERYAHVNDHSFDSGLGLFAGLNVLPKTTAFSTYSYSLDADHLRRLQEAFVHRTRKQGLYRGEVVNLDFHTVPHYGEESVLETHWAGARGKRMKAALTLFAQDADSRLILYTAADIKRKEADEQVVQFLRFWQKRRRGLSPTFVFDSRFTTYTNLSFLNGQGVKFITPRRRGSKLIDNIDEFHPWKKIHIPHEKRKFPNPRVHDSRVELKDYEGLVRQVIIKGNGREKPTFLITNDLDSPVEAIVGNYSRRWRVENVISEAVKFFHLNSLSSPILVKVHFDVIMTMIADTLYGMLAQKLRGFESCDASKLHRHFIKGKAKISVNGNTLTVRFPKKAHNPILRAVDWHRMPSTLPWLDHVNLDLKFL